MVDRNLVLLGPQVPLKEQLELDKDDESLRRWKEHLLGSVDLSAVGEPAVRIQMTIGYKFRNQLQLLTYSGRQIMS